MEAVLKILETMVSPAIGRLRVYNNKYCNVIYYHDIVSGVGDSFDKTNIDTFRRQMEYILNNGYETLLFQDLNDPSRVRFHKKRVLITFDDGWKSNYTEIFDYMQKKGIRYNVFLAVGKIGSSPEYLTWEMVKSMSQSGIVGFGVHTYSHVDFSKITQVDIDKEIFTANSVFLHEVGFLPQDFCYPYGYYSEESNQYLEKLGCYKRLYTSKKMYSYEQNGAIVFGRNGISETHTIRVFKGKLKGYYNGYQSIETVFVRPLVSLKKLFKRR